MPIAQCQCPSSGASESPLDEELNSQEVPTSEIPGALLLISELPFYGIKNSNNLDLQYPLANIYSDLDDDKEENSFSPTPFSMTPFGE